MSRARSVYAAQGLIEAGVAVVVEATPSRHMPALELSEEDIRAIAAFLASRR
jgi:hypothetical protein